jgi:hypothetical protein
MGENYIDVILDLEWPMTIGTTPIQADLWRGTAAVCQGRVGQRSIWAVLYQQGDRLFADELFADLFAERGRRSVPPRIVATVMVLQRLQGCSDREAVEAFCFDARWKYACGGLAYDYPGFTAQRAASAGAAGTDAAVRRGGLSSRPTPGWIAGPHQGTWLTIDDHGLQRWTLAGWAHGCRETDPSSGCNAHFGHHALAARGPSAWRIPVRLLLTVTASNHRLQATSVTRHIDLLEDSKPGRAPSRPAQFVCCLLP